SPLPSIPLAPLVEPDDELDLDFEGSARLDSGASPRPSTPDPSAGSAPHGGSAKLGNRPVANTIRVTAADAKEAVERLEGQLDDERNTAKHTTVPPSSDPDGSDVVAISFEDVEYEEDLEYEDEDSVGINEDTGSVGKAQRASPTVPLAGHDPLGQPATYVGMAPAPARSDSGMRVGMIVALAGVLAVALGGLSAYLLLGDQGETETETQPPTVATPTSDAREEVAARTAAAKPTTQDPEQSPAAVGTVTVRAVEGARVAVDGEDRGEAPVELELPLGEHRVRITAPGHHPWESTIDVIPGANPAVRAELVAAEEPAPTASTTPSKGSGGRPKTGRRPKAGKQPSAPSATDEPAPPKPEPKPDVFMDSKKGKDDGIFLPVGGQ
ncbi:MAG: PEGA domain-containing protein, partial [Nannocystaceae bacterium]